MILGVAFAFKYCPTKSGDDYFKHARSFTKFKTKSQILKSITHIKIPSVLILRCVRAVSLDLNHDFNTTVFSAQISFGSWLWWQSRNVVKNYVDCRRYWTKYIIFFIFSLSGENTLPKPPGAQQGISEKIWESKEFSVSSAEPVSTVRSPSYSCWLAICSGLPLGSGENPVASKGIWYSHWPFLASQAIMPTDLFSFGVLLLMFGCGDNATGILRTVKNQIFVRSSPTSEK